MTNRLLHTALVSLIALLACAALASAAGNVKAGRSYVGTIGDGGSTGDSAWVGSPIHFTVSANGKRLTEIQAVDGFDVPNGCGVTDLSRGGLGAFPNTSIVHSTFKATLRWPKSPKIYATVTFEGHFLPNGRATGTVTGVSNINSNGGPGPACAVKNPWGATAGPRGFVACNSFVLADAQAQYITGEHTACKVVDQAIRQGYPGRSQGHFSTPHGWKCGPVKIKTGTTTTARGHLCRRGRERFQLVIV